ncbi:hypothetical protein [uncultured Roseovarius sp.]|uniref:hypothetical protein n=1 Tax=uncultured Roseovarius sp. TaxID=293344 RepID=UPI0026139E09|nr:hypothetical protein [uncultured Roseovarius sp.]
MGETTAIRLAQTTFSDAQQTITALRAEAIADKEKAEIVHKAAGSAGIMGFADLSETLS